MKLTPDYLELHLKLISWHIDYISTERLIKFRDRINKELNDREKDQDDEA